MTQTIHGYSREELMKMNISALRAILHERTHHKIEVLLYRILKEKMKKPPNLGNQAKLALNIWKARGLPVNSPEIQWSMKYVELADKLNTGETLRLNTKLHTPFTDLEMKTVKKLLYTRKSIRQFARRHVSDEMIREILKAGLMAPQGCNVGSTRFIILRNPEEWKLVQSDIPIENGVIILICQDLNAYKVLKFDELVPQNLYYDAAAAADHMCLMAHAFGLGACWLTHGVETQKKIRKYFNQPETFVTRCHIVVGWPDEAPIKSARMNLDDVIITKKKV